MGVRSENGSYNGMIGMLQRNMADIAFIPMIPTYNRGLVADFGPLLMFVPFAILSGSGHGQASVFSYIMAFDWQVWALLLMSLPVLSFVLSLSDFVVGRIRRGIFLETFQNHIWELFGNIFCESSAEEATSTSSRILIALWWTAVIILMNAFAGHLKSAMALETKPRQIDNVYDVLNNKYTKPIIWKGSAYEGFLRNSESEVMKKMWNQVVRTKGNTPGREMFTAGNMLDVVNRRSVVMTDEKTLQFRVALFCSSYGGDGTSFHFAKDPISESPLVLMFSKHFHPHLFNMIYKRISWLYEMGIISKWMADSLGDWQKCTRRNTGAVATPLRLSEMKGCFVLLALALAISSAVFIFELLSKFSKTHKNEKVQRASKTINRKPRLKILRLYQ